MKARYKMKKKEECTELSCRLGKVGGQAVLEGVMMKAGDRVVTTCRKENGELVVTDDKFTSVREKNKILNLPIIRGVVNFIEMLKLSFKTLNVSAEAFELDDEKDKQKKAEGKATTTDLVMVLGLVLGVMLSIALFMVLPGYASDGIAYLFNLWGGIDIGPTWKAVIEGASKVIIFILYLALTSLMPDIKRTFMYHGAEHKSIACFEAGDELTPENAARHKRFHPRCGTSFMFFMILIGIIVGIILNNIFPEMDRWLLSIIRLAILPLIVGIGYEFIRFAGKHDNPFTRALSAPGLWVQRITTREPTEDMLEVAITSLKCALRDEFPEFAEFYDAKPWIKEEAIEESSEPSAIEQEALTEQTVQKSESAPDGESGAAAAEEKTEEEGGTAEASEE